MGSSPSEPSIFSGTLSLADVVKPIFYSSDIGRTVVHFLPIATSSPSAAPSTGGTVNTVDEWTRLILEMKAAMFGAASAADVKHGLHARGHTIVDPIMQSTDDVEAGLLLESLHFWRAAQVFWGLGPEAKAGACKKAYVKAVARDASDADWVSTSFWEKLLEFTRPEGEVAGLASALAALTGAPPIALPRWHRDWNSPEAALALMRGHAFVMAHRRVYPDPRTVRDSILAEIQEHNAKMPDPHATSAMYSGDPEAPEYWKNVVDEMRGRMAKLPQLEATAKDHSDQLAADARANILNHEIALASLAACHHSGVTDTPLIQNTTDVEDDVNDNEALELLQSQVAQLEAALASERTNVQRLEAIGRDAAGAVGDGAKMAAVAMGNIAARDKILDALGESCPGFLKEGVGNDAALAVPPLTILFACEFGPALGLPVPAAGVEAARAAALRALNHAGFAGANGIAASVWEAIAPLFALYMMAGQTEAPSSTQLPGPDLVEAMSKVKTAEKVEA